MRACVRATCVRAAVVALLTSATSATPAPLPLLDPVPRARARSILHRPIEEWPLCEALIAFFSAGFPLKKAQEYAALRRPLVFNDLDKQEMLLDRREVYRTLEQLEVPLPNYVVYNADQAPPVDEADDHLEISGKKLLKPLVEKPISGEDHNIYLYYPPRGVVAPSGSFARLAIGRVNSTLTCTPRACTTATRTYTRSCSRQASACTCARARCNPPRVLGSGRSAPPSVRPRARRGTDVKVYAVGPEYAHAEARKSPVVDGKVMRNERGREVRRVPFARPFRASLARVLARVPARASRRGPRHPPGPRPPPWPHSPRASGATPAPHAWHARSSKRAAARSPPTHQPTHPRPHAPRGAVPHVAGTVPRDPQRGGEGDCAQGVKQTVCGFDLLRSGGTTYVCDVNGWAFVKDSKKFWQDSPPPAPVRWPPRGTAQSPRPLRAQSLSAPRRTPGMLPHRSLGGGARAQVRAREDRAAPPGAPPDGLQFARAGVFAR